MTLLRVVLVICFASIVFAALRSKSKTWLRYFGYTLPLLLMTFVPPYSIAGSLIAWFVMWAASEAVVRGFAATANPRLVRWKRLVLNWCSLLLVAPIFWWSTSSLIDQFARPTASPPDERRF